MPRSVARQPSRREHRLQHEAVGVVELCRPERLARRDDLVAGREHGDAQRRPDRHVGEAERRDEPDVARRRGGARRQAPSLPRAMSSPARRRFAPRLSPAGRTTASPAAPTSSCMNTVSRPAGIGAPVKMRTAPRAGTRTLERGAGRDPPDDRQHGLAARGEVGEAHRVAVDGGVVEGRQVERRGDVLGQHAPVGLDRAARPRRPAATAIRSAISALASSTDMSSPPKAKQSFESCAMAAILSGRRREGQGRRARAGARAHDAGRRAGGGERRDDAGERLGKRQRRVGDGADVVERQDRDGASGTGQSAAMARTFGTSRNRKGLPFAAR